MTCVQAFISQQKIVIDQSFGRKMIRDDDVALAIEVMSVLKNVDGPNTGGFPFNLSRVDDKNLVGSLGRRTVVS